MSRPNPVNKHDHRPAGGLEKLGSFLADAHPDLIISKRRMRKVESIECVRLKREVARQNLGFSSRPFVLCGLPVRMPAPGCLLHERRNGQFVLQVTGHPSYGLPWGQDRLVPIFLATLAIRHQTPRITFDSAAEMLDTFGMQQGGSQYRRLVAAFQRIFGATIFFGTDTQRERAAVVHRARFNFMSEARIWYSRDPDERLLPGDCQNMIVLSDEFYREILNHPIPTDLEAAKALSSSPAALDLFMWLSYRCFTARGKERVPLFGGFGLVSQLGSTDYARPRKFREKLEDWLDLVRTMWPECPASMDRDGTGDAKDGALCLSSRKTQDEGDYKMSKPSRHIGSSLDDFLREEGILEETRAIAIKEAVAFQIQQAMETENITKVEMARRMKTSRAALDRLLAPGNASVTLQTLTRAARAIGRDLWIELV